MNAREAARQAREELYRERILEAAESVFADHGYDATKVQAIGERIGLSMGTIYSVFPGKAELFAAILAERGAELHGLARDVAERHEHPRDALDGLIDAYTTYFSEHPDFLRMHLRLGNAWISTPDAPERQRHWREIHSIQSGIFRAGIDRGIFLDEDPELLNRIFTAMDQALLADWVARGMTDTAEHLAARLRRLAHRTFRR